mgnify:CR=1 FL=1
MTWTDSRGFIWVKEASIWLLFSLWLRTTFALVYGELEIQSWLLLGYFAIPIFLAPVLIKRLKQGAAAKRWALSIGLMAISFWMMRSAWALASAATPVVVTVGFVV